MARLLGPDANSRLAYVLVGNDIKSAAGKTATFYTDATATVLANLAAYNSLTPTVPGSVIAGSTLTIDAYSMIPLFWFPDGVDTVWVIIDGGPVTPLNADYDARLDAAVTALTALTATVTALASSTVPASRTLTASTGLTGGGDLSANRTFAVDTSVIETIAGSTAKVAAHEADTTNVHGIVNTSVLETVSGSQAKVNAHEADTTNVHGITDTSVLETVSGSQAKVNAHEADTTNVHGITDTSVLETTTGAQAKATAAQTAAIAASVSKTGGGKETTFAFTTSSSTLTINLANGNVQTITMANNITTLVLTGATASSACAATLYINSGAGGFTISGSAWTNANVKWPSGSPPTLSSAASKLDLVVLETLDNFTTTYGTLGALDLR